MAKNRRKEDDRIERERTFHNEAFRKGERSVLEKYYSIAGSIRRAYEKVIFESCEGKEYLEYGCGTGSYACSLSRRGAFVTAIDISETAVVIAIKNANTSELSRKPQFVKMNAECLAFAEGRFAVICGTGILHHLDVRRAMAEVARTLHNSGKAVFIEPLGHNWFINAYRRLTPQLRTVDEHPLLVDDLRALREYFGDVKITYYYLFSLLTTLFRNWKYFAVLVSAAEGLDLLIFKVPFMRRFAWQVLIELAKPVKEGNCAESSSI